MPVSGSLFDGGWEADVAGMAADLIDVVADAALNEWRANLDKNIRVNQGRYVSTTRVTSLASKAVVNDGTSVYGPWLEGQGSRNYPVTRFRGYNSAETATDEINAQIDEIGAPVVARFVEAQNA